ncbi:hypothetical protein [Fictibacillus phosphorivorans]|uniref:hypothetical protein n=1 Tax=Fictibacillus phosphorivorans TaxID=1221500 RepID=UPI0035EF531C
MENLSYFKLNKTLDNPLRIFFLCGSYFNPGEQDKVDKRIILKKYIESINSNFKCLILEENFMFSSRNNKLNYNDIQLKSLKSIELITSLMSDKVIILHESISTAAEIGLFSSEKIINDKLTVLAPDIFSSEEDLISGFMKLAYANKFYSANNLNIIRYFPGQFFYEISSELIKPHFYFVNNVLGGNLQNKINNLIDFKCNTIKIIKQNYLNANNNRVSKYTVDNKNINVTLTLDNLVTLLISLFTVDIIKSDLRSPITKLEGDNITKRRRVFHKTIDILKKNFISFMARSIESEVPLKSEEINVSTNYSDINISQAIGYFVYVMYAIGMINIGSQNTKLTISNEFDSVLTEYSDLIVTPSGGLTEVLNS